MSDYYPDFDELTGFICKALMDANFRICCFKNNIDNRTVVIIIYVIF